MGSLQKAKIDTAQVLTPRVGDDVTITHDPAGRPHYLFVQPNSVEASEQLRQTGASRAMYSVYEATRYLARLEAAGSIESAGHYQAQIDARNAGYAAQRVLQDAAISNALPGAELSL